MASSREYRGRRDARSGLQAFPLRPTPSRAPALRRSPRDRRSARYWGGSEERASAPRERSARDGRGLRKRPTADLERHLAIQASVTGAVHLAHSADAKRSDELVETDGASRLERHVISAGLCHDRRGLSAKATTQRANLPAGSMLVPLRGSASNALPALANIDPPRMCQLQVRYVF